MVRRGGRIHIIGLTGGIATGKSTVARILIDKGYPVIDADQIARDVVRPGQPILEKIIECFGDDVLAPSGELDRRALGRIVFNDDGARRQLESITHPQITIESQQAIALVRSQEPTPSMAFYENALLVEMNQWKWLDSLVVVNASPETQRIRLLNRDSDLAENDVDSRIASQMPMGDKVAVADVVIDNDGGREQLEERVDEALAILRRKLDG